MVGTSNNELGNETRGLLIFLTKLPSYILIQSDFSLWITNLILVRLLRYIQEVILI